MEVGGWVMGAGSTRKKLENSPMLLLIFWGSIPCVFYVIESC